jgi:hypothetical protein
MMKVAKVYTANTCSHDPKLHTGDVDVWLSQHSHLSCLASARHYKTIPHLLYPEYDWTIWVDANVLLNVEPEELIKKCGNRKWGAFKHSHRDCVYDELHACRELGFVGKQDAQQLLQHYERSMIQPNTGLGMTMVLVRKNCPEVNAMNIEWWQQMCYYSMRDQLTFTQVFGTIGLWPSVDFTKSNKYFTRFDENVQNTNGC